jgi:hypothetical protein
VVTTIYDLFTCKFPGCNGRCRASVAYSFPYSGIRAILHSFLVWIFYCTALIGSVRVEKRWKLIVSDDWMASLCSFSVVCTTCTYWLESPLGLAACTVSEFSQWAEVMCSSLLMKIETFWRLRFGLIGSIGWDFIDVIYEIPCGVCCCCLRWFSLRFYRLDHSVVAVYCSDIIVSIEFVLCLTCFCREWCEWYDLNIMWWYVCNICATCVLQDNTTGLRLFHYCITTCVPTYDGWSLM